MSYQKPDEAFINYNVYQWGRLEQHYRGPRPRMDEPYIACLGGAQTFGRYTTRPFPTILSEMLGMEVANFGAGGAGPGFFLRDSMVMEAANSAEVCVVQVMSARSLSNRLFKVKADRNAQIKAVSKAMEDLFPHVDFETFTYAHNMLNQIEENDPQRFVEVEMELKTAWVARTRLLLESIHTKKILFWFSERAPAEEIDEDEPRAALKYPQFVDDRMLEAVAPYTDKIVHCISDEGLPQSLLVGGESVLQTPYGMPVSENRYYPSPEMHRLAAEALARPIYDLIVSDGPGVAADANVNI